MKTKKSKKINQKNAVYSLALAGITSAIVLLLIWLSVVVRFSTIAFFFAGGLALTIPLFKKYYFSSLSAYVVASLLAFAIVGDVIKIVGFIAYFGPISIISILMFEKKIKWYFAYPIKILYINGALALLYFACNTLFIDANLVADINYAIIALVGTLALLLLDFIEIMSYKYIVPIIGKVLRDKEKSFKIDNQKSESDENYPFEEFDYNQNNSLDKNIQKSENFDSTQKQTSKNEKSTKGYNSKVDLDKSKLNPYEDDFDK